MKRRNIKDVWTVFTAKRTLSPQFFTIHGIEVRDNGKPFSFLFSFFVRPNSALTLIQLSGLTLRMIKEKRRTLTSFLSLCRDMCLLALPGIKKWGQCPHRSSFILWEFTAISSFLSFHILGREHISKNAASRMNSCSFFLLTIPWLGVTTHKRLRDNAQSLGIVRKKDCRSIILLDTQPGHPRIKRQRERSWPGLVCQENVMGRLCSRSYLSHTLGMM